MAIRGSGNNTGWLGVPFDIKRSDIATKGFTFFQWNRNDNASDATAFLSVGVGFFNNANDYHLMTLINNASFFPDELGDNAVESNPFFSVAHTIAAGWVPSFWVARPDRTIDAWTPKTNVIVNSSTVASATTPYTHYGIGQVGTSGAAGGQLFEPLIAIAHAACWTRALTTNEFVKLCNGASPLTVATDALLFYFPLDGDLQDYGPRGVGLSQMGTNPTYSFIDGPRLESIPWEIVPYLERASFSATLTASTKKAAANFTGLLNETGTITGTTKKAATSFTGIYNPPITGTINAASIKTSAFITDQPIYNLFSRAGNQIVGRDGNPLITFTPPFNLTGTITATPRKAIASFTGKLNETGTINATTRKPIASFTSQQNFTGNIAARPRKPVASFTSTFTISGTITATPRKPIANIIAPNLSGTIDGNTRKPIASFLGRLNETGTINGTTRKPTANLNSPTTITAFTRKPLAVWFGSVGEKGTITGTTRKPTANFTGLLTETGTINARTRKPVASLSGTNIGNQDGVITARTRKPVASLTGSLNETGVIGSTTKKAVANITGTYGFAGVLNGRTRKPVASFTGKLNETGTINSTTKKPTANLTGALSVIGSITGNTRKSQANFSGITFTAITGQITGQSRKPIGLILGQIQKNTRPMIIWTH